MRVAAGWGGGGVADGPRLELEPVRGIAPLVTAEPMDVSREEASWSGAGRQGRIPESWLR